MYLKTDFLKVEIDDLTFYSHNANRPAPKYLLDPTALIGWTDGVDIKRSTQARQQADGDFKEETFLSSRVITVSGTAIANYPQQIHRMRDSFMRIFWDEKYKELAVTDILGTRFSTVSLANKPSWIQETDTVAVWKIEFYAPDPYIYGVMQTASVGSFTDSGGLSFPLAYPLNFNVPTDQTMPIAIKNNGNALMWPSFEVRGNYISGFTITNSYNKKVTYNGTVTVQAPVTIDMARGTAIQDGVDKSYLISDRQWISVAPDTMMTPEFIPIQNGIGWCYVHFRDTWI